MDLVEALLGPQVDRHVFPLDDRRLVVVLAEDAGLILFGVLVDGVRVSLIVNTHLAPS